MGKRKRDVTEDGRCCFLACSCCCLTITTAPQPAKPITSSSSSKADTNIIDELLDESEAAAITQLDASSLKQMLGSFEKKITKNQKLRMKHSDEPEKFMESECELHAELEALHLVAAYPELYPVLLASNCLPSILGMITHENTDISIAAVSLLQEMLDSEDSQAPEQLQQLVDAFVAQHGLELITQNLLRLNESNDDDAQGVHNTLSILDSLLELDDAYANLLVTQTGTLSYLMKRINTKAYDANKLYATEVLSIIIQKASKEADRVIGAQDGLLEELLQAVAIHRKKDMKLAEEVECMENIFLCLGTLLLQPSSRAIFLKLEGMELLLRCLQAQEAAAFAALPALSSALLQHAEGCQRFVDVGGLKFIFSYLLLVCAGDATHKHRRTISSKQRSLEESLVSSIAQLCTQLDGEHAARLASKLVEGEHAKLAVCCRLFAKYAGFLHKADQDMQRVRQRLEQEGDDEALEELMDPDSIYIEVSWLLSSSNHLSSPCAVRGWTTGCSSCSSWRSSWPSLGACAQLPSRACKRVCPPQGWAWGMCWSPCESWP